MLINILENYTTHLRKNPNSLIAKIYGLFTYENSDLNQKFNLIVMKNVSGFSRKYIRRTYDIKGSKYDRQVIRK